MDMPTIVSLGTNSVALFVLFGCLTLALHYLLVSRLSEVQWKVIDYIWLSVAALGLIGQSAQIRQQWSSLSISTADARLNFSLVELKRRVAFSEGPAFCRAPIRTELSPKDFGSIEKQYRDACNLFKKFAGEVLVAKEGRMVGFLTLQHIDEMRGEFKNGVIIDELYSIGNAYKAYLLSIAYKRSLEEMARPTVNESIIKIFSPFLLVFALALRLTKVTGEIWLKRGSRIKTNKGGVNKGGAAN